jgi:hypothetical protein
MFLLTVKRSPSCYFLHIPIFMGVLEIHLNRGGLSTPNDDFGQARLRSNRALIPKCLTVTIVSYNDCFISSSST